MFSIQILIAVAVTVGVALAVTLAFTVAGVLFRRDQARAARAMRPVTTPAGRTTEPDDARELVLR
jgi:UPF0716 family protein affecting phage T7 exclusion